MREHHDGGAGRQAGHVFLQPFQLRFAQRPQAGALQVDHIHQPDEVHAMCVEAVPAVAFGALAVAVEVALAVFLQYVVLPGNGVDLQSGRFQKLRTVIEFLGLGQMRDVAGVNDERRLVGLAGHLLQRFLEGAGHVGVDRLVEAQMAVADLREAEALGLRRFGRSYQAGGGDAPGNTPDRGGARPAHTGQKAAAVLVLGCVCHGVFLLGVGTVGDPFSRITGGGGGLFPAATIFSAIGNNVDETAV